MLARKWRNGKPWALLVGMLVGIATVENDTAAKSLQSCLTLCNPIDGSPPGSPVPGILQERTLEWVAISFSNAWQWKVKVKSLSRVRLCVTPWTAAYQAPPSMGFSRQEYWSGVPLPSPAYIFSLALILSFSAYFYSQLSLFMITKRSTKIGRNITVAVREVYPRPSLKM